MLIPDAKYAALSGQLTERASPAHEKGVGKPRSTGDGSAFLKKIYDRIYDHLPQRAKVLTSELSARFSERPHVYHDPTVHPSHGLPRGAVTFSIDFELAWAWIYARGFSIAKAVQMGLHEREQVPLILAKMDEYETAATWATVGHLFLEKCDRNDEGIAHAELARLPHFESAYWLFRAGDWYQHDPCTDYKTDPAWYAPDLIHRILTAKVKHEMGCHSFSHGGFGSYCSHDVALAKIDACIAAMKPYNLSPKTWVFPGNDVGNFVALAQKGFTNVRAFPVQFADVSLPIRGIDGMWYFFASAPIDLEGEGWDYDERLRRLKRFVDKAIETKLATHIWFHPSLPAEQMEQLLFPLLQYCAEKRDEGLLDVLTMDDLAHATASALRTEGRF